MTVGALREALADKPDTSEVVIYADWQAAIRRPLALLDEHAYVCGHFAVVALEQDRETRQVVLMTEQKEAALF